MANKILSNNIELLDKISTYGTYGLIGVSLLLQNQKINQTFSPQTKRIFFDFSKYALSVINGILAGFMANKDDIPINSDIVTLMGFVTNIGFYNILYWGLGVDNIIYMNQDNYGFRSGRQCITIIKN